MFNFVCTKPRNYTSLKNVLKIQYTCHIARIVEIYQLKNANNVTMFFGFSMCN